MFGCCTTSSTTGNRDGVSCVKGVTPEGARKVDRYVSIRCPSNTAGESGLPSCSRRRTVLCSPTFSLEPTSPLNGVEVAGFEGLGERSSSKLEL